MDLCLRCGRLRFERHRIAAQLDAQGHYEVELDREFPFHVRLFHFRSRKFTPDRTWHERLELFLPLDGPARLRMGEHRVELAPGDTLVVDNLKLHNVEDFPELDTRVLDCYFQRDRRPYFQAGCKASFLSMLYPLARRFEASDMLHAEFLRQQQLAQRLNRLFEHLRRNFAQRTTVREAARLVNMGDSQFMKVFKRVAGTSFVAYLTHLRVANARQLLRASDRSVAEIAAEVGFADQSYFDRRFKQAFGMSPRRFRLGSNGGGSEESSKKNAEAF